jgi:hypothetical protein
MPDDANNLMLLRNMPVVIAKFFKRWNMRGALSRRGGLDSARHHIVPTVPSGPPPTTAFSLPQLTLTNIIFGTRAGGEASGISIESHRNDLRSAGKEDSPSPRRLRINAYEQSLVKISKSLPRHITGNSQLPPGTPQSFVGTCKRKGR